MIARGRGWGARCSVVYRYVCRRAGLTLRIYNEKRGGQKVSATIYVHHFNYLLSKLQSNALLHPPIHTVQPHLHCKLLQIIGNLVHKMKRILCIEYNVLQVCTDTVQYSIYTMNVCTIRIRLTVVVHCTVYAKIFESI